MKPQYILLIGGLVALFIVGCGGKPSTSVEKTYVVKPESVHKTLFFTGTIEPLHESAITSPADAVIETMYVQFGQRVKKGGIIMVLNSSDLQKQYNEALMDYLKSKDNYNMAKVKFAGTEELWDAGLIAKNNYLAEKSNLDTVRMSLMQNSRKLNELLEKTDDHSREHLAALNMAQFDKVKQALISNHHQVRLKAPSEGVLLYPPKNNDNKSSILQVGASVKAGQVIALVGDLTGIRVNIDVPEVDIDKIHVGMPARVTGVALGSLSLHGQVVAVNAQATDSANGGLPSFTAAIEVTQLASEEQGLVKVGMSASIDVAMDSSNQLLIPIAAVKQEKGQATVVLKKKNGSLQTQTITLGFSEADKVAVVSGLAPGDVVTYG